jgi:hypothetical protein
MNSNMVKFKGDRSRVRIVVRASLHASEGRDFRRIFSLRIQSQNRAHTGVRDVEIFTTRGGLW